MIAAKVVLDAEGRLVRFEASGHGGAPAGSDIVCAAFTVLARTAYEALAALPGAEVEGAAPGPGLLRFSVRRIEPGQAAKAEGIADFLLTGISGLEREFPGRVGLSIERYWRE
ncbi:MAG TPA: ribosomal-processing cysteine protease Prp [Spirochaetales bacterium]|nr:ribosomal-processing cysteine protease Prp [Spirochaetales bacterium]HRY53327.1 ribosomal-processing cysteine protease Prp [Spirochaetia bacterium]HRZ64705.1 ribosomal-processing cysteine protease Prp [Spirochaetia bacterium]